MPKGFVYTPQEGDPLAIEKMQLALRRDQQNPDPDYNRQDRSLFGVRRHCFRRCSAPVFSRLTQPHPMEKSGMVTTTGPFDLLKTIGSGWGPIADLKTPNSTKP